MTTKGNSILYINTNERIVNMNRRNQSNSRWIKYGCPGGLVVQLRTVYSVSAASPGLIPIFAADPPSFLSPFVSRYFSSDHQIKA